MGIARFPVECPGCKVGINLRLGVGHEERQRFFFVCPRCKAATRAVLVLDEGLELQDGRLLEEGESCAFSLNINPEFPSVPDAASLHEPGGSAFLMAFSMLGQERFMKFSAAAGAVRSIVASEWPKISRLTTYYVNRDWTHFDAALVDFVPPESGKPTAEWHRDAALHEIYDRLFIHLAVADGQKTYIEMKSAWTAVWASANTAADPLLAFAKGQATTQEFRDVQRDLFEHVRRYVENLEALFPGLLCNMLPDQHQPKVDHDLRLFRDDYEVLRDLYIQTFETCHKALRWVVGAMNVTTNGNADKFVAPAGASALPKKLPKDLSAFTSLTSAQKRKWLVLLPDWDQRWDAVFDRHLRNDIGHASAHHDLASGRILRAGKPALAYTRFVGSTMRTIYGLLAMLNALKTVRMFSVAKD